MNNDQQREQWVNEALSSLDGVQRATANPYLFTRIQQRLARKNSAWEKVAGFIGRPAFALSAALLFLFANFYVATHEKQERMAREKQKTEQMFAAEYGSSNNMSNELNANR